MAISFISKSDATGTANAYVASLTITKPANTANDDLLVAIVAGTRSGGVPSGWTQLNATSSGSNSLGTVYTYYKIASSEGSSYTFNFSDSFLAVGTILCYRGADLTTPIDGTNVSFAAKTSTTNYDTGSATSSGTQWAVSFGCGYEFGSSSARTFSEGSGTERTEFAKTFTGSPDNTNITVTDSNGNVSAGSFSRTQTRSSSADKGVAGLFFINQAGISVSLGSDGVAHATTAAQQPTILIQTVQSAAASTAAHNTSVGFEVEADVADDGTAVAHDALRPMLPTGVQAADVDAEVASVHLDVNARLSSAEATAYNASGYYGAAVVRVYVVPSENRTYKVER